tara:strand:+ start:2605 stop:2769 length:165 start_codon:yes stop_codon:yes gene_type:complete
MGKLINIRFNEGGFMLTLFSLIGFGITLETDKEKSITFTFKLWKLHVFNSIAIM